MKKLIIPLLSGVLCCCLNFTVGAQKYSEQIRKEFTLTKDASTTTLFIYNIFGSLKVEGYPGNQVIIEVEETLSADDNKTLETGKREFKMGFIQNPDSIIAYIAQPFDSRPNRCNNNRVDIDYNYKADFTVKVPFDINLQISTVNDGLIYVKDVAGTLRVNNVNEGITIVNAKATTRAHTVNGDVTINYMSNPAEPCSYNTINGNINVTYQPDLSADFQFKSMNGEFFTDFPAVQSLPVTATKNEENRGGKMVYKLDKTNVIRFGNGGKVFKVETLNGNVYIKKQS